MNNGDRSVPVFSSCYNRCMKAIVVANWKMHPQTFKEAKRLFDGTKKAIEAAKGVSVIVAPPAVFVRELSKGYRGRIAFATQGARAEAEGAFTGDVSLAEMKDARCTYAIIGHAERRAKGETNEDAAAQLKASLTLGMAPVLCVGEGERSADGRHFSFIKEELRSALSGIKPADIKKLLIAYEPVWAIGAAKPMTARDMHEMSIFIRKCVVESVGETGMDVRILYGGSIDEHSARPMIEQAQVHGLLVGRASVDIGIFSALLESLGS